MSQPSDVRPTLLAYHFPQYHRDPRNDAMHGPGWSEWELVAANCPRFPGHQPLKPAWGMHDEADPDWMAREIDLAADSGLDGFIFDTYWYGDGPFLHRAITDGFLRARNRSRLRFCCMWANHPWRNLFPCDPSQRPWNDKLLMSSRLSDASLVRFAAQVAGWMREPNYLCVNGRPYFSIFDLGQLMRDLGSEDAALRQVDLLRETVRRLAGTEMHLNFVCNRFGQPIEEAPQRLRRFGADSVTPYNAFDHSSWREMNFPVADWDGVQGENRAWWTARHRTVDLPYIPNLTSGWDVSPRARTDATWERRDYPWLSVTNPTAEQWRRALQDLRGWHAANPGSLPFATINAWNEWTEGAVLLPSRHRGDELLRIVREVFGPQRLEP